MKGRAYILWFFIIIVIATIALMIAVFIGGSRAKEEERIREVERKRQFRQDNEKSLYEKVFDVQKPQGENQENNTGVIRGLDEVKVGGSCPYCGSTDIQAVKKGFSAGKAAVGAMVAGTVGLAAGAIGSNKIERVCLRCGKTF